jgi:dephospho-CoA kinase
LTDSVVARQVYPVDPVVSQILTEKFEEATWDAQTSQRQRLALADDILDNSGSLEELEAGVDKLYHYTTLAVEFSCRSPLGGDG